MAPGHETGIYDSGLLHVQNNFILHHAFTTAGVMTVSYIKRHRSKENTCVF